LPYYLNIGNKEVAPSLAGADYSSPMLSSCEMARNCFQVLEWLFQEPKFLPSYLYSPEAQEIFY
jgi:hypothetical protein